MGYLKWYGHAAFEFEIDGVKGIIDPWIKNPLSPVKPRDVKGVEIILVTHDHGDHYGEAVEISKLNEAPILGVYEVAEKASKEGAKDVVGMNVGGTYEFRGLKITMVHAIHSSSSGTPVGYILRGKETTVYHAGDTGVFQDMRLFRELYEPKIALLPIGGYYTMGPYEAFKAVEYLNPDVVIPMHYNTFPVIKQDPEEFKKMVESKMAGVEVIILRPGEAYTF